MYLIFSFHIRYKGVENLIMRREMKYIIIIFLAINLSTLFAKGVAAGTVIQNSATLSFTMEEETFSIESNVEKSIVAQVIDVKVSWMDTRAVGVSAGESDKVLTFRVTNSGNGRDRFTLKADELDFKSAFSLMRKKIYLDTNNNFRFDASDRERKAVTLGADREKLVFVVSKIDKSLSVASGSQNFVSLKAISKTGGSGEKGTVHEGKGIDGVDAVDGFLGGMSEDEGVYTFLIANVVIKKDVYFSDGLVRVLLTVTVRGEGHVRDVKIVDKIPQETKYVKGSLRLDGDFMSDQRDADSGRYKKKRGKRKARVVMSLGELDTSSFHTITYSLKIG